VVFNEKSLNELMQHSFAVVLTYSTVAYQAVQMGLSVIILKAGYYEGQYDLFGLPNVRLLERSCELNNELIKKMKETTYPEYRFFDPLDRSKFSSFIENIKGATVTKENITQL